MSDHVTPAAHSGLVGGSTAARRVGCVGSLYMEAQVPGADEGSPYAQEGTALHELMATILLTGKEPEALLPFTFTKPDAPGEKGFSFTVDEQLFAEKGAPALQAFDDFVEAVEHATGKEFSFRVEQRVEFPGIADAYGTSDVVGVCDGEVFVIDWKFGRGEVEAENNWQLAFYAMGALNTCREFLGVGADNAGATHPVTCAIIQPMSEPVLKVWETDFFTLSEMADTLRASIAAARSQGPNAPLTKGDWCRFARCRAICPLHTVNLDRLAGLASAIELGKDAIASTAEAPDHDPWGNLLGDMLDLADDVEAW